MLDLFLITTNHINNPMFVVPKKIKNNPMFVGLQIG